MVEPCLLAREIEVALDIDAASFIMFLWLYGEEGPRIHFKYYMMGNTTQTFTLTSLDRALLM